MNLFTRFAYMLLIIISNPLLADDNCQMSKTVRYPIPLKVDFKQAILSPLFVEFKEVANERPISGFDLVGINASEAVFFGYIQAKQQQRWEAAYRLTNGAIAKEDYIKRTSQWSKQWDHYRSAVLLAKICQHSSDLFVWRVPVSKSSKSKKPFAVMTTRINKLNGYHVVERSYDHLASLFSLIYYSKLTQQDHFNKLQEVNTLFRVPLGHSQTSEGTGISLLFNGKPLVVDLFDLKEVKRTGHKALTFYAQAFKTFFDKDKEAFLDMHTAGSRNQIKEEFEQHTTEHFERHVKRFSTRNAYFAIEAEPFTIIFYLDGSHGRAFRDLIAQKKRLTIEHITKYSFKHDYLFTVKDNRFRITNARYTSFIDRILNDQQMFVLPLINRYVMTK